MFSLKINLEQTVGIPDNNLEC